MARAFLFALYSLLFVNGSCLKELKPGVYTDKAFAKTLRNAPTQLYLDDNRYELSVYLWRNFMPPAEKDGGDLRFASKFLMNDAPLALPSFIVDKIFIVHGDTIWITRMEDNSKLKEHVSEVSASGGPKWQPDSEVDVICAFSTGKKDYKMKASKQRINAVY